MEYIDLHIHTYFSDGNCSPSHMVDMAADIGLKAVAITDHDNLSGVNEGRLQCKQKNISFIPGVEFSTLYNNEEIHILAYMIDEDNEHLKDAAEYARDVRKHAIYEMIQKLNAVNVDISVAEYEHECNIFKPGDGGWPLLNLLKRKEYVSGPPDYFGKYFAPSAPCYVPFVFKRTEDIIEIVRSQGCLPVLAHPGSYTVNTFSKKMLFHFMDHGLGGIEAYSVYHSAEFVEEIVALASAQDLIVTGGSDCHGDEHAIVKRPLGGAHVPAALLDAVMNWKS